MPNSFQFRAWISAFRLRTLPLAFSSIALGSFLAASHQQFDGITFGLALLTTLFLQILSNLANDYGDSKSGADNDHRIGPERAVQSGAISLQQMKKAIIVFSILALISGLSLIYFSLRDSDLLFSLLFLVLGLAAIVAAIKYTVGQNPYGYSGLGDLFVFMFFGIVGVGGVYFLHTQSWNMEILLPAAALGLLSAGVLNLNNMRDYENDEKVGKITLAIKLGKRNAKVYHLLLLGGAITLAILYTLLNYQNWYQYLFLLAVPIILLNIKSVFEIENPRLLDPLLKRLALGTLLFAITFGLGLILS